MTHIKTKFVSLANRISSKIGFHTDKQTKISFIQRPKNGFLTQRFESATND